MNRDGPSDPSNARRGRVISFRPIPRRPLLLLPKTDSSFFVLTTMSQLNVRSNDEDAGIRSVGVPAGRQNQGELGVGVFLTLAGIESLDLHQPEHLGVNVDLDRILMLVVREPICLSDRHHAEPHPKTTEFASGNFNCFFPCHLKIDAGRRSARGREDGHVRLELLGHRQAAEAQSETPRWSYGVGVDLDFTVLLSCRPRLYSL